jgi:hypothetical protein
MADIHEQAPKPVLMFVALFIDDPIKNLVKALMEESNKAVREWFVNEGEQVTNQAWLKRSGVTEQEMSLLLETWDLQKQIKILKRKLTIAHAAGAELTKRTWILAGCGRVFGGLGVRS